LYIPGVGVVVPFGEGCMITMQVAGGVGGSNVNTGVIVRFEFTIKVIGFVVIANPLIAQ
jgi:hypothetical protein